VIVGDYIDSSGVMHGSVRIEVLRFHSETLFFVSLR
jgi:hypothetical protein